MTYICKVTIITLLVFLLVGCDNSIQEDSPGSVVLSFKCDEPLPEFTLGQNSNPSKNDVKKLCGCIWDQFPVNGWERTVSEKLVGGEEPGWQVRAFPIRFRDAMEKCGGGNL